jgi:hypothetical protein
MTRRKKVPTVQSFGGELMSLLLQGSTKRMEVILPTNKDCIKLRHRLHILRSAMRHYDHTDAELVEKARISIEGTKLIAQPQDIEYGDAIRRAGAAAPTLEIDPLAGFEAEPGGSGEGKNKS